MRENEREGGRGGDPSPGSGLGDAILERMRSIRKRMEGKRGGDWRGWKGCATRIAHPTRRNRIGLDLLCGHGRKKRTRPPAPIRYTVGWVPPNRNQSSLVDRSGSLAKGRNRSTTRRGWGDPFATQSEKRATTTPICTRYRRGEDPRIHSSSLHQVGDPRRTCFDGPCFFESMRSGPAEDPLAKSEVTIHNASPIPRRYRTKRSMPLQANWSVRTNLIGQAGFSMETSYPPRAAPRPKDGSMNVATHGRLKRRWCMERGGGATMEDGFQAHKNACIRPPTR